MVSNSRANPEVLQTGNSLGKQAVPSYVFCTHMLGPQSTPSGAGMPFALGTLALGKGEGRIVFLPPFSHLLLLCSGLALVCRNSFRPEDNGARLCCADTSVDPALPHTSGDRRVCVCVCMQGLEFKSQKVGNWVLRARKSAMSSPGWSGLSPWQVSPQEMVQEIHQVLMDREDTCHRTCFSLHLDGNMLDHFSELRSVEGLQEGSVLRVVEGLSASWVACQGRAQRGRARCTPPTLAGHR